MKLKLAEALLRRKELQGKVDRIKLIQKEDLYVAKVQRRAVHEGIDDVIAAIPKLLLAEVTAEYDFYAKELRLVDAAIQQANWTTEIECQDGVLEDYPLPMRKLTTDVKA